MINIGKTFLWILLSAISVLSVISCCTQVKCIGADDLETITFYGFNQQNLDTIVILKYEKNSGFIHPLDSTTIINTIVSNQSDFRLINLNEKISVNNDYKIDLTGSGQSFTLTDLTTEKMKCNTGFLCHDIFTALKSYKINGQTQIYGSLRIDN